MQFRIYRFSQSWLFSFIIFTIEKKSAYKWTHTIQTCAIQESTKQLKYLFDIYVFQSNQLLVPIAAPTILFWDVPFFLSKIKDTLSLPAFKKYVHVFRVFT